MFWLRWKKLEGSYFFFKATNFAYLASSYASVTPPASSSPMKLTYASVANFCTAENRSLVTSCSCHCLRNRANLKQCSRWKANLYGWRLWHHLQTFAWRLPANECESLITEMESLHRDRSNHHQLLYFHYCRHLPIAKRGSSCVIFIIENRLLDINCSSRGR